MSDLTNKDFKFDLQLFAEGEGEGGEGTGGEGGEGFPEWMAQLPTEYKKDEYGKGYKTIGEFYKTHKGLRAKIDGLPKPPEKASEYEFTAPAEDSGIKIDADTEKWFRKLAFDLKMPKDIAGKLFEGYTKRLAEQIKAREKAEADAITKADELMHGEWGEEFDKNMKYVDKAIEDLGGEELRKLLDSTGMGKNPTLLRALKQVGFEHSEDTIKEGVVTGSKKESTMDDLYPSMKGMPDRQ